MGHFFYVQFPIAVLLQADALAEVWQIAGVTFKVAITMRDLLVLVVSFAHNSFLGYCLCRQQNNSQRTAVFDSFWPMNTDHLTNTRSCSFTSTDVNLLQPSDAIVVYRGRKT